MERLDCTTEGPGRQVPEWKATAISDAPLSELSESLRSTLVSVRVTCDHWGTLVCVKCDLWRHIPPGCDLDCGRCRTRKGCPCSNGAKRSMLSGGSF